MASDILIVDDEADIRELISGILEDEGHSTRLAKDSDETLAAVEERQALAGDPRYLAAGLEARRARAARPHQDGHPDLPVVIISGHGNIETAVAAIKRGAYDYIEKPFKADRLVLIIDARARGVATEAREPRAARAEQPIQLRDDRPLGRHQSAPPGDRQGGPDQ